LKLGKLKLRRYQFMLDRFGIFEIIILDLIFPS
jgi:hypothetical protein